MALENFSALKEIFYEIDAYHGALNLMGWDRETYMPKDAIEARSEQLGILARLQHQKMTDSKTIELIEKSANEIEPGSEEEAMLRVMKRSVDLATKLPSKLVEEISKVTSKGQDVWAEAKKNSDFKLFEPYLQKIFDLTLEQAEHLGYKDQPYDALLDQYEEGTTTKDCDEMFSALRPQLVTMVRQIVDSKVKVDRSPLMGQWDKEKLRPFLLEVIEKIGFDLNKGRLDESVHPFCAETSSTDVRLTTYYQPLLLGPISGAMHEAGHGMYEQGSPLKWARTPLSGGVSMGVHESQSRFWENIVGRSKEFWSYYLPKLQKIFPEISNINLDDWYLMVNKVEPDFIRVEADEVTYNLHVLIRFEIEKDILNGKLQIKDVPEVWDTKYQEYLGIRPKNDAEGCLQDIHWAGGNIGYFPTYTLGNLLSYQAWNSLKKDIVNTSELMSKAEFGPIHNWLQEKIYSQGKRYTPKELILKSTGKKLEANDYLDGLNQKYSKLYSF